MKPGMVLSAVCALAAVAAEAALELAPPFTDCAVLQRGMKLPVWGVAEPGDEVTVSFAGQSVSARVGANGAWRVDLAPLEASAEPRTLSAAARPSGGTASVQNVLVGEVWLCSGQSNMGIPFWGESPRARDRYGFQIGQITRRPLLRCARLGNDWSDVPRKDEKVVWEAVTPSFLLNRGFSAVALWYGLAVHDAIGIPVGLVGAYVGATDIETWIPGCRHEPPESRRGKPGQGPSQYYNGKIAPIVPYAMRGAIWYQGEANTSAKDAPLYCGRMHDLHDGFRRVFENPSFRLYFSQLAPWGNPNVPLIQEQQARFAAEDPDAGMAVICDTGNLADIHPNDKLTVGVRLALLALKRDYGFSDIVADSPTLESWRIEDGRFVMKFRDVRSWSLYDPDWRYHRDPSATAEMGFEVAGGDGRWVKAQIGNLRKLANVPHVEYRGQIDGEELVVFSPEVKEPKALRYLHSKPWRGYLMNEAGLPVGAFHIDSEVCK